MAEPIERRGRGCRPSLAEGLRRGAFIHLPQGHLYYGKVNPDAKEFLHKSCIERGITLLSVKVTNMSSSNMSLQNYELQSYESELKKGEVDKSKSGPESQRTLFCLTAVLFPLVASLRVNNPCSVYLVL